MRTPYVVLATIAGALLATRPALANGRFPASNQIVFSPTNDDVIIGRATYAILPSTDNGKHWGFLCEDVLALPGATNFEDPEIGVTYNNSIVAGLFAPTKGLNVSNDLGCNWNCAGGPLAGQQIADVVVRPDTAPNDSSAGSTSHQVLALVSTLGTTDAGNSSSVYESPDDGATWAPLNPRQQPLDTTVAFATIDVAKSDPARIYLSGNRGFSLARTASLFVSTDNGANWTEHPLGKMFNPPIQCKGEPGMCPSEDSLFIAGVDPTDENVVYLRSNGLTDMMNPGNSVLYMTTDAGATFQVLKSFALPPPNSDFLNSGEVLGFALSPDGSTIYAGTKENGLFAASKADPLSFTNVNSKVQVECLADRALKSTGQEELWACSSEKGGFVFGKSTDQGKTFMPMMSTITSLSGQVACSPTATASTACLADANAASICSCSGYQLFCTTFETSACFGCGMNGPPAVDAGGGSSGGSDAGNGGADGGTGGGHSKSGCGCSVVGGGGAAGMLVGCGIMAIALRRRRAR